MQEQDASPLAPEHTHDQQEQATEQALDAAQHLVADLQAADSQSASDAASGVGDVEISFVIPCKDEDATLVELYNRIVENTPSGRSYEVVFVDDGSRDGSWKVVRSLAEKSQGHVRGIRLRTNFGKAQALAVGFNAARGDLIFTLDADLQDDPTEIPNFLAKLDEGFDLVVGWKKVRHDPWHKVLPSRAFNWMLSRFSGVQLHDHNCGFKCYRGDLARRLCLHGELHRMTPTLAAMQGYRCTEIEVVHHPRRFGRSKYGFERFFRGFSDMLTIGLLRRYQHRPSHLVHAFAFWYAVASVVLFSVGAATSTLALMLTGGVFFGLAGAMMVGAFCTELLLRRAGLETVSPPVAETTGRVVRNDAETS